MLTGNPVMISKIVPEDELRDNLCPTPVSLFSIMCLGWFDLTLTYHNSQFLFLYCYTIPSLWFHFTSRYSTVFKSVSTVTLNPNSLINWKTSIFYYQWRFFKKKILGRRLCIGNYHLYQLFRLDYTIWTILQAHKPLHNQTKLSECQNSHRFTGILL